LDKEVQSKKGRLHSSFNLDPLVLSSTEFWDEETLATIGNTLCNYIKSSKITRTGKYTAYARICLHDVYPVPFPNPFVSSFRIQNGIRPWIMNTYPSDAENAMNMDTCSKIAT
jgi:hypothetical protein